LPSNHSQVPSKQLLQSCSFLSPPIVGAPVVGAPVVGAPVIGAPVIGAPVIGAPVVRMALFAAVIATVERQRLVVIRCSPVILSVIRLN
jgi:hypothetical protein